MFTNEPSVNILEWIYLLTITTLFSQWCDLCLPLAPLTCHKYLLLETPFFDFGLVLRVRGCVEARVRISHPALLSHS